MATLSNGEFVFSGAKRELLLLEKGTHQEPHIIYGGEVLTFACSGDETIMALAFPPTSGRVSCVVRLYTFASGELGDALGEIMTECVKQLLWVGSRYLVICGQTGCTIYTWKSGKLKFYVSDNATSSFLQSDLVALYYESSQTLKYWNLDTNRMMDSIKLIYQGRRLISTIGVGYFGFALFHDGTLQVFYVTKSGIKRLEVFSRLLPVEAAANVTGEVSPQLLACALSSRKVLIGLRGDNTVHKLEYKNEKVVVDSMQEELLSPHILMSISRDGRRALTLNTSTSKYQALVLAFQGSRALVTNGAKGRRDIGVTNTANTAVPLDRYHTHTPTSSIADNNNNNYYNGSNSDKTVREHNVTGVETPNKTIKSLDSEDTKSSQMGLKKIQNATSSNGTNNGNEPNNNIIIGATFAAAAGVTLTAMVVLIQRIISQRR